MHSYKFLAGMIALGVLLSAPIASGGDYLSIESLPIATLTSAEEDQIIRYLNATAFDEPQSWTSELTVRNLALGRAGAYLVRGTNLLCGGTGNCQTWIFSRSLHRLTPLLDEPLLIDGLQVLRTSHNGLQDLRTSSHLGAQSSQIATLIFNGRRYHQVGCWIVDEQVSEEIQSGLFEGEPAWTPCE